MSAQVEHGHRVTPLELFFDLVFVFGFTQVTTLLTNNPTWSGLGHGLLVMATLWWAWASYAWLTNAIDPEEVGLIGGALLVAMGAMFVAGLAVPSAFGRHGVLFGVAFLIVTATHISLSKLAGRDDPELYAAVLRVAPASLAGSALIIAAGFVDGGLKTALWLAAIAAGLIGPLFLGVSGWSVRPAHFVERHGLILIIAIGESLIAIGIGARDTDLSAGVIVAAVLGLFVATSFWLAYFDFFALRAEQILLDRTGTARVAIARDAFTYLHLPMVAGIVLFAFAMKPTLAHVGHHLATIPALGLCVGPALYLASYVGVRYRISRTLGGGRQTAAVACAALFPVARVVPALLALALVAAVWAALHVYEIVWWREDRARTRELRRQTV